MTFLDKIINDTAQFDPSIKRHKDGSVTVYWRSHMYGNAIKKSRIAAIVGVDADMIVGVNLSQLWALDIPKEMVEQ